MWTMNHIPIHSHPIWKRMLIKTQSRHPEKTRPRRPKFCFLTPIRLKLGTWGLFGIRIRDYQSMNYQTGTEVYACHRFASMLAQFLWREPLLPSDFIIGLGRNPCVGIVEIIKGTCWEILAKWLNAQVMHEMMTTMFLRSNERCCI